MTELETNRMVILRAMEAAGTPLHYLVEFERATRAEAWAEGYKLDWTGGMKWPNPYQVGP